MKGFLTSVKIFFIFFFVAFFVVYATLFIQEKFNVGSFPSLLGYSLLIVSDDEMEPIIKKGNTVFVEVTQKVDTNQMIVINDLNRFVVRELIGINGTQYITKSNKSGVSNIYIDQVIGKVITHSQTFSNIIFFIKKPIILILLALLGLVVPEIGLTRYKEQEELKES